MAFFYRLLFLVFFVYLLFIYLSLFSFPVGFRRKVFLPFYPASYFLAQGFRAYQRGNLRQAWLYLQEGQARRLHPFFQAVLAGLIEEKSGRQKQAYNYFLKAQGIWPEEEKIYAFLLHLAPYAGKSREQWLPRVAHLSHLNFDLLCDVAEVYAHYGEEDKAFEYYQHCALKAKDKERRAKAQKWLHKYTESLVP